MKPKTYLVGFAAIALAAPAHANVTVDITGSTAFRQATLEAIHQKFVDSGVAFKFAHDIATSGGTNYNGATRSIWIGTFPGVGGTTTIRTCFTGSVEGVRALVGVTDPTPPTYYQPSLLTSTTATVGGAELANQGITGALTDASEIAFSDVAKAVTPYSSYSLKPASPAAGVVVFTMLTNKGSTITNVTSQQFRSLFGLGKLQKRFFTGVATDTSYVYATGRNDGSGTRTTYLAETGFGVTNLVKQYVVTGTSGTAITEIQLVPAGGGSTPGNASTVWGNDVDGNGGYSSGSLLRGDMAKTTASVNVLDEYGDPAGSGPCSLVTWLSVGDAVKARGTGDAVFCAYNGVRLDGVAASGSALTAADQAKVTEGAYTAWGFQQMYRRNDINDGTDTALVYDGIKAALPAKIGSAGVTLAAMHCTRIGGDGGTVAP